MDIGNGSTDLAAVSVIGLGRMGSALARAFHAAGHSVTAWNRSPDKAEPLIAAGLQVAPSVREAVDASEVVVVCVLDYPTSDKLLGDPGVTAALRGKTLVQLTSGTPAQARFAAAWAHDNGVDYLDGGNMSQPSTIGTPNGTVLYAGKADTFERQKSLLESLGGLTIFVGEEVGTAAALDVALVSGYLGFVLGLFQGAAICQSEGIPLDTFGLFAQGAIGTYADSIAPMMEMIKDRSFEGTEATLDIWAAGVSHIGEATRARDLDPGFGECVLGYMRRAIELGHGQHELAAMFEAFATR